MYVYDNHEFECFGEGSREQPARSVHNLRKWTLFDRGVMAVVMTK